MRGEVNRELLSGVRGRVRGIAEEKGCVSKRADEQE